MARKKSLLKDDREQYVFGGLASIIARKGIKGLSKAQKKELKAIEKHNRAVGKKEGLDKEEINDLIEQYKGEKIYWDEDISDIRPDRLDWDLPLSASSPKLTEKFFKDFGLIEGKDYTNLGKGRYEVYDKYQPEAIQELSKFDTPTKPTLLQEGWKETTKRKKILDNPTLEELRIKFGFAEGGRVEYAIGGLLARKITKAVFRGINKLKNKVAEAPDRYTKEYWDGLREKYLAMSEKEQRALNDKFFDSMDETSKVKISSEEFDMVMWNEVGEEATGWKPYYQAGEYTKGRFYEDIDYKDIDLEDLNIRKGANPTAAQIAARKALYRENPELKELDKKDFERYKFVPPRPADDLSDAYPVPDEDDIPFAEGGDVDKQMVGLGISVAPITEEDVPEISPESGMESDEEMEDGYIDFIVSQSLSPEEETTLMTKLEADPELSIMFDKVMETATEFSGSGPVNGPGSEVSDSIPARLSDGEFVFTAKATEQIGVDRLQSMMEDAEMQASAGRQEVAIGGEIETDEKVDQFGKPLDEDIAKDEIKKGMLSINPRLQ